MVKLTEHFKSCSKLNRLPVQPRCADSRKIPPDKLHGTPPGCAKAGRATRKGFSHAAKSVRMCLALIMAVLTKYVEACDCSAVVWNTPSTVVYNKAVLANGVSETLDTPLATPDLSGTGDCSASPCDVSFTISVDGSTPSFVTMQDSNKKMVLAVLTSSHIGTHELKIKYDSVGSGTKPASSYTAA